MTRGAVFYYVKDKQALFNAVIERFIFDKQNINNKIKCDVNDSLEQFIRKYLEGIKSTMDVLRQTEVKNILRAYLNLSFNALTYYERYVDKVSFILSLEQTTWTSFIDNAKAKGEIKSSLSTNVIAETFQSIFYGVSFVSAFKDKDFDVRELENLLRNYYSLL